MVITQNISDLNTGDKAVIQQYTHSFIACKLSAMGLLPGDEISLVRKSAFGNTLYIKTENNAICLRANEAKFILITPLNTEKK